MTRRPNRWRKLARALLALLLGTLLLELGLRAVGWAYLTQGNRVVAASGGEDDLVVLCVGDSNVFGVFEETEDTYPAQLQHLLETHAPDRRARVLNLGVPGLDTHQLVRNLEDQVQRHRPHVLLVTAGVNNLWAWIPPDDEEAVPWYEDWRLVRLFRLARHRVRLLAETPVAAGEAGGGAEIDPEVSRQTRGGEVVTINPLSLPDDSMGAPGEDSRFAESVRRDVARCARIAEEAGALPLVLLYLSDEGPYARANGALREAAAAAGVGVLDATPRGRDLASSVGFGQVFHLDLHPTALGYELVARTAFNALVERGVVHAEPLGDAPTRAPSTPTAQVRLRGGLDGELRVEIRGEAPNERFQLVLYGLHHGDEAPPDLHLHELPNDPLFRATSNNPLLAGRFDDGGSAVVPLAPAVGDLASARERLLGARVHVAYVVLENLTTEEIVAGRRGDRYSAPTVVEIR